MVKSFNPTAEDIQKLGESVEIFSTGMDKTAEGLGKLSANLAQLNKMMGRIAAVSEIVKTMEILQKAASQPNGYQKMGLTAIRALDGTFMVTKGTDVLMSRNDETGELKIGSVNGYQATILTKKEKGSPSFHLSNVQRGYSESFNGDFGAFVSQNMRAAQKLLSPEGKKSVNNIFIGVNKLMGGRR